MASCRPPTTLACSVSGRRIRSCSIIWRLDFSQDGRSIKRMIRYIVLSRTYQMSSHADPAAVAAIRRICSGIIVRRSDWKAKSIRDALLSLSGRLDATQFGEPVPIHLTSFMDGRGRPGKSGPLDGAGRRSIYTAVRRNFLSPFMLTFDTPVPFSTMGRRNVSNVPAQALILMNDPLVVELASKWAERAIDESRVRRVSHRLDVSIGFRATTDAQGTSQSRLRT